MVLTDFPAPDVGEYTNPAMVIAASQADQPTPLHKQAAILFAFHFIDYLSIFLLTDQTEKQYKKDCIGAQIVGILNGKSITEIGPQSNCMFRTAMAEAFDFCLCISTREL